MRLLNLNCGNESSSASRMPRGDISPTVLAYHQLTTGESEYLYGVSSGTFENHLQLIAEIRESLDPECRQPLLSFDDGHISNYSTALPLLEKYQCKAIFFVIAGRISQRQDFMTWAHLRELISLGHRVEAHSWSHPFLTNCSDSELHTELIRSKETLEDELGLAVRSLSAPHGRWNRRVAHACGRLGYTTLYTSDPWMSPKYEEGLEIVGRLMVQRFMSARSIQKRLKMNQGRAVRRARYALKQSTRYLLGDTLYHRLWLWRSGWRENDDRS
jgi:peptidoglycan/xylan/chitin deacetylase (PgdA/CDA1 family)